MLCETMRCNATRCYAMPLYVTLSYDILIYAMPRMLCHVTSHDIIFFNDLLLRIVLYGVV